MKSFFEFDCDGRHESITVQVEVKWSCDVDYNYGADADGNRGARQVSIDLDYFKIFKDGQDVTTFIRRCCPDTYSKIEKGVNENVEQWAEEDNHEQ